MASEKFRKQMLLKQQQFFEKVKAAFVLNTSFTAFGDITDGNLKWLMSTFPKSTIRKGRDQGAKCYTITPKF